jgi:polar amino acid transport system substrate-binding protein
MFKLMPLLLFCGALLAAEPQMIKKEITLCYDHWPPATIHASIREPRHGFMVDTARDIFSRADYAVTLREVPYARGLHDVVAGSCDIMLLMPKLNMAGVYFPQQPGMLSRNGLFVPTGSNWHYRNLHSLDNLRVGNIIGYDYSSLNLEFATFIAQPSHGASIVTKGGNNALPQLLNLLALGRLDVMVEDERVAHYVLRRQGLEHKVKQVGVFPATLALYPGFSAQRGDAAQLAALWDRNMQYLQTKTRLQQRMADY